MANENDEALNEILDGSIEEAETDEAAAPATEDAPADTAGDPGVEEAPAPAAWQPPAMTQADYEALRRNADIGARYSPHQKHIDAAIERALNPQAAPAPVAKPAPDEYETLFGTPESALRWATGSKSNMDLYLKGQRAIAKRVAKEAYDERLAKLEADHGETRQATETFAGWAVTAADRFQANPATAAWWNYCVELQKGGMSYPDARKHAQDRAALEAKAKGASPAQAAAAGKAVGAAISATATGKAPAKPARPDPVNDPTMTRQSGGKKTPPASKEERVVFNRDKGGRFEKDHVEASMRALGIN